MTAPQWLTTSLVEQGDPCCDSVGWPDYLAPRLADLVWEQIEARIRPLIANPYFAQVTTGEVTKTDATRLVFVDDLLEALA